MKLSPPLPLLRSLKANPPDGAEALSEARWALDELLPAEKTRARVALKAARDGGIGEAGQALAPLASSAVVAHVPCHRGARAVREFVAALARVPGGPPPRALRGGRVVLHGAPAETPLADECVGRRERGLVAPSPRALRLGGGRRGDGA